MLNVAILAGERTDAQTGEPIAPERGVTYVAAHEVMG
jgi:hypothetical protein